MCELQVVLDSLAWFVAIILMLGKGANDQKLIIGLHKMTT